MVEKPSMVAISQAKLEANRKNAQLSTGPKTEAGKSRSSGNALKHGILISAALITRGFLKEDSALFQELLNALRDEFEPVGAMESLLVEQIAVCYWRLRRALLFEAGLGEDDDCILPGSAENHRVPRALHLNRLLRYEGTAYRQLAYACNQLERKQRAPQGRACTRSPDVGGLIPGVNSEEHREAMQNGRRELRH